MKKRRRAKRHYQQITSASMESLLRARGLTPIVTIGADVRNRLSTASLFTEKADIRRALCVALLGLDSPVFSNDDEIERLSQCVVEIIADRPV